MSEERTTYKVEFDLDKFRARLERQGAIAFDDIEFLIDELAAAHARADKAETEKRAWTEIGAREQARANAMHAELEAARAVVAIARRGFGTGADVLRAWAFDPTALSQAIVAYDAARKGASDVTHNDTHG